MEAAREQGSFVALDAHGTLDLFMVDGMPDETLLMNSVGPVIERANNAGRGLRVYGEMVGVLAAEGNYAGAVGLEGIWNKLRRKIPFLIYCGYPMSSMSHPGANMEHICDTHAKVIPGESYTTLPSVNERLRAIAALQQRNMQLEAELAAMEARIVAK